MAVLVTGGAGFLGSHLVDRLVADHSQTVVVFDNLVTGRIANLERAIPSRRAIFVYTDVASHVRELEARYDEATAQPLTAIYHLASPASARACAEHAWETLGVNSHGTMQLLELAQRRRATFLFASAPLGPPSCYDEAKRFGEAATTAAANQLGVDARIVRIFDCYGPRMRMGDGELVPAFVAAAQAGEAIPICGDGLQTRSLTFVRDIVDGLVRAARGNVGVAPVDLGRDEDYTVLEIACAFARVTGVAFAPHVLDERPEDAGRRKPSLDAVRKLGWAAQVSLDDGLRETLAWYRVASRSLTLV